jgi:hypothetical protein
MNLLDTNKKLDNLLTLGQLLISEATELRTGLSKTGQAARKGLSQVQKSKLIARRYRTAIKGK